MCFMLKKNKIKRKNCGKSHATALRMGSDKPGSELPMKNPLHWMDLSSRWVGIGLSRSTAL